MLIYLPNSQGTVAPNTIHEPNLGKGGGVDINVIPTSVQNREITTINTSLEKSKPNLEFYNEL